MTFSALWGRITGKDKRQQMPVQQAVVLGRIGDYVVAFPYGLYADLPADAMLKEIAEGVMIPVTVNRPSDTEQGEPVFFHPATGSRIIARNNGDLDIIAPQTTITGNLTVNGTITNNGKDVGDTHSHIQGNDSDGDVEAAISGVT